MQSKSLKQAVEFLGKKVFIKVDRPIGSRHPRHGFVYEANYGFVPGVKAPDGEDLDAYFLGTDKPLKEVSGICVAIVHRKNDDDDKLIILSEGATLTKSEIIEAIHFQEQWFETEILFENDITSFLQ